MGVRGNKNVRREKKIHRREDMQGSRGSERILERKILATSEGI